MSSEDEVDTVPDSTPSEDSEEFDDYEDYDDHADFSVQLPNKLFASRKCAQLFSGAARSNVSTTGHGDRANRATNEQVLDPRTRLILQKFLNNGLLASIHGCVSTGKEANVYAATSPHDDFYAVKVFKTSILVFKDRERYVEGEFRYRRGFSNKNPRKMVQTWAEKELRNLKRIYESGILSPKPIALKGNVLIMEFFGDDGWPSPRIKDVILSPTKWNEAYHTVIKYMRILYQKCRLVHADLSEYNMLYHHDQVVFIDVSQSVEHDHPHALEFLRMDVNNVTEFFVKKNVNTLSKFELFAFVADPNVPNETIDDYLFEAHHRTEEMRENVDMKAKETAFMHSYIPRTLFEVHDAERDIFDSKEAPENYYKIVSGLNFSEEGQQTTLNTEKEKAEENEEENNPTDAKKNDKESTKLTSKQRAVLRVKEERKRKEEKQLIKKEKKKKVKQMESSEKETNTAIETDESADTEKQTCDSPTEETKLESTNEKENNNESTNEKENIKEAINEKENEKENTEEALNEQGNIEAENEESDALDLLENEQTQTDANITKSEPGFSDTDIKQAEVLFEQYSLNQTALKDDLKIAKKENKKIVKEAQREKRKGKLKKKDKKKLMKS